MSNQKNLKNESKAVRNSQARTIKTVVPVQLVTQQNQNINYFNPLPQMQAYLPQQSSQPYQLNYPNQCYQYPHTQGEQQEQQQQIKNPINYDFQQNISNNANQNLTKKKNITVLRIKKIEDEKEKKQKEKEELEELQKARKEEVKRKLQLQKINLQLKKKQEEERKRLIELQLDQDIQDLLENWNLEQKFLFIIQIRFFVCQKYDIPFQSDQKLKIEDFIFTLANLDLNQMKADIQNWINDDNLQNFEKYKKLIPIYFNILKRGESWKNFLSLINYFVRKNNKHYKFNIKFLFMIIYLNSNPELQLMLLKLQYKYNPVPLLYLEPSIDQDNQFYINEKSYIFNDSLLYIFEESLPIFSFSLGKASENQIGKTDLINNIFYKQETFEVKDEIPNNKKSIDIMFDCAFGKSRNFCIADTHGDIDQNYIRNIANFFDIWIIQIQYKDNYDEIIQNINKILEHNQSSVKKIILFVRDVEDELDEKLIQFKSEVQQKVIKRKQSISSQNSQQEEKKNVQNLKKGNSFDQEEINILQQNQEQLIKLNKQEEEKVEKKDEQEEDEQDEQDDEQDEQEDEQDEQEDEQDEQNEQDDEQLNRNQLEEKDEKQDDNQIMEMEIDQNKQNQQKIQNQQNEKIEQNEDQDETQHLEKELSEEELEEQLQQIPDEKDFLFIEVVFLSNLNKDQLVLMNASKVVFDSINQVCKLDNFKLKTQNDFINYFLKKEGYQQNQLSSQIQNIDTILQELEEGAKLKLAYLDEKMFPMRSIDYQIKQQKEKLVKKKTTIQEQERIHQKILKLENSKQNKTISKIIQLFIQLLTQDNCYLPYLLFIDKLRNFNEKTCHQLYQEKSQLIQLINNLTRQKGQTDDTDKLKEINDKIKQQQMKLSENEVLLFQRQIAIEIFWREIFAYNEINLLEKFNLPNPVQVLFQMIKKGEPFEFLDGDNLKIERNFMEQLCLYQQNKGLERVLVLTVLGPQSSGKSTILNKIFGCHFWTSVGRCTKGIYAQLLKIQDQNLVQNLYDYLLILDSEGLQSPTQLDEEFDKKIALFTIAISDIILINVKGDLHSQFKNLVEICVQTMGKIKNSFSQVKQINWCFNQNADTTKVNVFIEQIADMANNILSDENDYDIEKFKAAEILQATDDNVKVLGFASEENKWKEDLETGIWQEWAQTVTNEAFSEEAYKYGIQIIQNIIQKKVACKDEWKDQYTLREFFRVSYSNWNIISSVYDLLEFFNLREVTENSILEKTMNQQFEKNLKSFTNEVLYEIEDSLKNNQNFETLSELQVYLENNLQIRYDRFDNTIQEQLKSVKQKEKILTKRIIRKYESLAKLRLQNQKFYLLINYNGKIQEKQALVAQTKGILSIEKDIQRLIVNENELNDLKQKNQLENYFESKWTEIINQQNNITNSFFDKFTQSLFATLEKDAQGYLLKNPNHKIYIQKMQANLKNKVTDQEFQSFYKLFQQEITKNSNFMFFGRLQSYQWLQDIFNNPIEIKAQDLLQYNGYIQLNNMFEIKKNQKGITKQSLLEFFNNKLSENFISQVLRTTNKFNEAILKQRISDYFYNFQYFGVQLKEQCFQKLITLIKKCLREPYKLQEEDKKVRNFFENQVFDLFQQCSPLLITEYNRQQLINNFQEIYKLNLVDLDHDVGKLLFTVNQSFQSKQEFENYIQDIILETNFSSVVLEQNEEEVKDIQLYLQQQERDLAFSQKYKIYIDTYITQKFNWYKLFSDIFYLIQQKINQKFTINEITSNITEDIENFITDDLMKKILYKIIDCNKQLGYFGMMINQMGEQLMYYFTILFSWRILSYKVWELISNYQKDLIDYRQQALDWFKMQLNSNQKEVNKKMAETFGSTIIKIVSEEKKEKLILKLKKELHKMKKQFKSSIISQQCDQEIFSGKYSENDIWNYIRDPIDYVQKKVETQLQEELKKQINNEIQTYQNELNKDISIILDTLKDLNDKFITEKRDIEYFEISDICTQAKLASTLLFEIFCVTLQGPENNDLIIQKFQTDIGLSLKKEYIQSFLTRPKNRINLTSSIEALPLSDRKIIILKDYIKNLSDYLQTNKLNYPKIQNNYVDLDIQSDYDLILKQAIGCTVLCPACNKKCDQDQEHKLHKSSTGHYLRVQGLNGLVIKNVLSQMMCEEISDEQIVQIYEEQNYNLKWKQIQNYYIAQPWDLTIPQSFQLAKQKMLQLLQSDNNKLGDGLTKIVANKIGIELLQFKVLSQEEISGEVEISSKKLHKFN